MQRYKRKRCKNSAQFKQVARSLRPPRKEVKRRLLAIANALGATYTADLMNVSVETMAQWLSGRERPARSGLKLIWVLYGMFYAQHEVRTVFDVMTWGRFSDPPESVPSVTRCAKKPKAYTGYINPS